jgi:hypothetical protein
MLLFLLQYIFSSTAAFFLASTFVTWDCGQNGHLAFQKTVRGI